MCHPKKIEDVVKQVVKDNPCEHGLAVRGGMEEMTTLIGKVLKEMDGMADPRAVHMLIRKNWKN